MLPWLLNEETENKFSLTKYSRNFLRKIYFWLCWKQKLCGFILKIPRALHNNISDIYSLLLLTEQENEADLA